MGKWAASSVIAFIPAEGQSSNHRILNEFVTEVRGPGSEVRGPKTEVASEVRVTSIRRVA